jgi:hypothetical protein
VQALQSLAVVEERYKYAYYMHADDDSYVRVDQVLQLLVSSDKAMLGSKASRMHAGDLHACTQQSTAFSTASKAAQA